MFKEVFNNEIKLKEDECCIVFDFGCYYPYEDAEHLFFDFEFDGQIFNDKVINHRYPNKSYQIITKKYGRRLSKIGYPYIFKLDKQGLKMLHIKVGLQAEGLEEQHITLNIPVETHMTKDKPVCALTLHNFLDKGEFIFKSMERTEGEWHFHKWTNSDKKEIEDKGLNTKYITFMNQPCKTGDLNITYGDIITPCASKIDDLIVT